jgi:hypothetical protein
MTKLVNQFQNLNVTQNTYIKAKAKKIVHNIERELEMTR